MAASQIATAAIATRARVGAIRASSGMHASANAAAKPASGAADRGAVLIGPDGELQKDEFARLLQRRNQRPVKLSE